MATTEKPNRKAVRRFFKFQVDNHVNERRKLNWGLIIGIGAGGLLLGTLPTNSAPIGLVVGVLLAAAIFAYDRFTAQKTHTDRQKAKDLNHEEFRRLADEVRRIQSQDLTKALLRVVERAQINTASLRVLDEVFISEQEKDLFRQESIEEKIGELSNKSVRFIAPGEFINKASRTIRWQDTRQMEDFFNPMRLVVILMTDQQFVVCDVQIDSMDGDLMEDIQKISISKVVSLTFKSQRHRRSVSADDLTTMAKDLGYSESEIADIRRGFSGEGSTAPPEWVYEDMFSTLHISRMDGQSLSVPIRIASHFGKHESALDGDSQLSQEERKIDRIMNELNRLILTA